MTVYDWSKVRRETLEKLAHAMLTDSVDNGAFEYHTAGNDAYNAAVEALRNAVAEARPAPLRTRAEVDAEIGYYMRIWSGSKREPDMAKVMELCREPLAPDPKPRRPKDSPVAHRELDKMWDATHDAPYDRCDDCVESIARPGRCAKCRNGMPSRSGSGK